MQEANCRFEGEESVVLAQTKPESQTPTETSSEFHGEALSCQFSCDEMVKEQQELEDKKQINKVKYRKLKQKLNNMGSTHDERCALVKEIGGPNKQKIMKLALDFEKHVKIQNRDCSLLEGSARELLRFIESRAEQEVHLLRQSKMIPAIFELLQKVPMLHKVELSQVLKTVETSLKIVEIVATLRVNRDYLIQTNRLNHLVSFVNWLMGKDEKGPSKEEQERRSAANSLCSGLKQLAFKLINLLLSHRSKSETPAEKTNEIVDTTLKLIMCSQLFRKVKHALTDLYFEEGAPVERELCQEMLKFVLISLRKSQPKVDAIEPLLAKNNEFSVSACLKRNSELQKNIEFLLPSLIGYFCQVLDSEETQEWEIESMSNSLTNLINLVLKVLNACFEVSYVSFKKILQEVERSPLFAQLLAKLHRLIAHCKREYEEEDSNSDAKLLLNEIIVFLGYLALEDASVQKKIYDYLILEQISDLPIQFMMDSALRDIVTPTLCCLLHENKTTLNFYLKDNSPLQIIKYLRKEIQNRPSLNRKGSTASLINLQPTPYDSGSYSYELHRNQLSLRFPYLFWEELCLELEKQN